MSIVHLIFFVAKESSVVVSYLNLFYHIWGLKSIKILVFFVAIGEEYDCKRGELQRVDRKTGVVRPKM